MSPGYLSVSFLFSTLGVGVPDVRVRAHRDWPGASLTEMQSHTTDPWDDIVIFCSVNTQTNHKLRRQYLQYTTLDVLCTHVAVLA